LLTVDGRPVSACEGDTVGSALFAAGVRILSRSFKYHRPRGLFCSAGNCASCLMAVDGRPNVRTCLEPVRDGMSVRSQHAWPSLRYDLFAVLDRLDRWLPVGFYYKTFIRPRWLWPAYEWVLRRLAGIGRVDPTRTRKVTPHVHLHTTVAVIGGGPAGLAAALAAAQNDCDVILVDDQPVLGGHLLRRRLSSEGVSSDFERAQALGLQIAALPRIRHLARATAFGLYEGGLVGVAQPDRLLRIRAERVVVATGGFEHPEVFPRNDLPGVMLAEGALRLAVVQGVRPGNLAVVTANDERGLRAAAELHELGIRIAAVADARATPAESFSLARLRSAGVRVLQGYRVAEARGRSSVESVVLAPTGGGSTEVISCDLLALGTGWEPAIALVAQSGIKVDRDESGSPALPADLPPNVYAAGEVAGARHLEEIEEHGRRVGELAARGEPGIRPTRRRPWVTQPLEADAASRGKSFVCLCEDVTVKDLSDAVAEGFDHIETLKRYSTVTMGPCQGKACHLSTVELCARLTGRTAAQTGRTTARPPWIPIPMGTLAGPRHEPVRRTALHRLHERAGAHWMDMGAWKRPAWYTSVDAECRMVHDGVGLIDVSTLGKLEVTGDDAADFLDWIHSNRTGNLPDGRVRYRLMLDDAGIVIDDGTVARLADTFFVTTGTGTLGQVQEWLEWWSADGSRCIHVTDVTAGFAAINVAGPRSRELLSRLTREDLSNDAAPYLSARRLTIADVPAIALRIGFLGELAYELHFPADYAEHLWTSLLDTGKDLGCAPFGVETQRVLRLEKSHLIPGQDTDASSNPLEAGLEWAVKLDKPDFVGRAALLAARARPPRQKLVSFQMIGSVIPLEGEQVVLGGRPVGRVTSAKWSERLGRAIGLAWVPDGGESTDEIEIRTGGAFHRARISNGPLLDPTGERLRG
jgi:sarcosine oxidase subunit alpha